MSFVLDFSQSWVLMLRGMPRYSDKLISVIFSMGYVVIALTLPFIPFGYKLMPES